MAFFSATIKPFLHLSFQFRRNGFLPLWRKLRWPGMGVTLSVTLEPCVRFVFQQLPWSWNFSQQAIFFFCCVGVGMMLHSALPAPPWCIELSLHHLQAVVLFDITLYMVWYYFALWVCFTEYMTERVFFSATNFDTFVLARQHRGRTLLAFQTDLRASFRQLLEEEHVCIFLHFFPIFFVFLDLVSSVVILWRYIHVLTSAGVSSTAIQRFGPHRDVVNMRCLQRAYLLFCDARPISRSFFGSGRLHFRLEKEGPCAKGLERSAF